VGHRVREPDSESHCASFVICVHRSRAARALVAAAR
jgi:hypothetical protein